MSEDENEYKCDECDRSFGSERGLKVHKRVHEREKADGPIEEKEHLINDVRVRLAELREQFKPFRGRVREMVEMTIERGIEVRTGLLEPEPELRVMPEEDRAKEIEKRQELIEVIVKKLEAEINAVAVDIIKGGLKDGLLLLPAEELQNLIDREDLRIRRGRPGRSRDCVYLEFGDGLKEQTEGIQLPL